MTAALAAIPGKLRTTSRCKCSNILWLLRSITLTIAGLKVVFTRVQHALKREAGRHVQLTADMHDDLNAWRELVRSLSSRPTHLRKLAPFAPTCIGTTDALGSGMEGEC